MIIRLFTAGILISFLASCGGSDEGSSGDNMPVSGGGTIGVGSTAAKVNAGTSQFIVRGLKNTSQYIVWVHNLSEDVSLATYIDAPIDAPILISTCSSNESGLTAEQCNAVSSNEGKFRLAITSPSDASLTITVHPSPENEGTTAAPVALSAGTAIQGQVGIGASYYSMSGLTPGAVYNVSMSDILVDAELSVSMQKNFSATCTSSNTGQADESCLIPANFQGNINIITSTDTFGAYYSLTATATGDTEYIFEGFSDEPVDITGSYPYSAQVNRHNSYYVMTGLTPGTRYEVRLIDTTVDVQIYLFDTPDFVNVNCDLNYYGSVVIPSTRRCVSTAPSSGNLYLQVPYFGTTGGVYDIDLVLAPIAEGTSAAPKEIAATTIPYDGQVDVSFSYYVITGLIPDIVYAVEFNNVTHWYVDIAVGSDPSSFNLGCTSPCAVRSNANGEISVKIDGTATDNSNNDLGAWFTIALSEGNNSEGTASLPVSIPTDGNVYSGQVDDRTSYYIASGLTPNQYYLVYIRSDKYSGPSAITYLNASDITHSCYAPAGTSGTCLTPANTNGEIYINVNYGSVYGSLFDLWVNPSLIASQGSANSPIDISGDLINGTNTVINGQVSSYRDDDKSYYQVLGLPGSSNYSISLSNLSDDARIDVFSDIAMSNQLCASSHLGLRDENCAVVTAATGGSVKSSDLYIQVSYDKLKNRAVWDGATYTLTVSAGGETSHSEGTIGTPLDVTTLLPYAGTVKKNGGSYYQITGLDPSLSYSVGINIDGGNVGLAVSADANFNSGNFLCRTSQVTEFSKQCSTSPNAQGAVYVEVAGNSYTDEKFILTIGSAPVVQGSALSPIDITTSLPYMGQVDASTSYYQINGLTPETKYLVSTKNASNSVNTKLYSDADFMSGYQCFNNGVSPAESCVGLSNINGELFVSAKGSSSDGAFFDIELRIEPATEGSVASPINVSPKTVYQGSNGGNDSYYKVTGLTPYSSHRVSLITMDNIQWVKIYSDSSYQQEVCYSSYSNYGIGCGASANTAGEIYFKTGYTASYYEIYVP